MFFEQLPQQLVNGIILGSIYALLALGYTMVYGIIKLINFAHGDIYMIGAFVGYYAINSLKMNFWIALVFSMIVCAILQTGDFCRRQFQRGNLRAFFDKSLDQRQP